MASPKADCEGLMNSALPFVEQMLTRYGEFIPFGCAMRPEGQFVSVAGYDGNEHPKSLDIIDVIKSGFISEAHDGKYVATAIFYDVRVTLPSTGEQSDAIAISLDHLDNYSVIVFIPYTITAGNVVLGDAYAEQGEADIFVRR